MIAHFASKGSSGTQNVLREFQELTSNGKRNINADNVITGWSLIFIHKMMRHVKRFTGAEARRRLVNDSCIVTLNEFDTVFSIMYARGLYGAKNFPVCFGHQFEERPFFLKLYTMRSFQRYHSVFPFRFENRTSDILKTD